MVRTVTIPPEPVPQQAPAPGAQPAATPAQKVVLYEEDPADPNRKRFVGSAIWRHRNRDARSGPAARARDPSGHRSAGA